MFLLFLIYIYSIFISNGASECVRTMLYAMIRGPSDGIMVPIPQYPLYSGIKYKLLLFILI